MNCKETRQQTYPYLDQQIDAAQRQALEGHLAQCPACAKVIDSQRAFLGVIKKLVVNCGPSAAPESLRARLLTSIDAAPVSAPPQPQIVKPAPRPLRLRPSGAMAAAAAIMLGFGGLLAAQSMCLVGECPIVVAAQLEHEKIIAGARPPFATSDDLHLLTKAIKEHGEGAEGFPSLCHCKLNPLKCGRVKVDGLPEGAYVQYAECNRASDPVTLMIINTDALSGADVMNVKDKEYRVAKRGNHVVLSWHSEKNNKLYILVAHRPLELSLEIAEVASAD